jgi:putative DNA primase/helicase
MIMATGNNLRPTGDLVRRVLICNLDAKVERPELKVYAKDPLGMIAADRGKYVSACLTIMRAYIIAGRPGRLPPLGSFEAWSDNVRSALVWLGLPDPVASMEGARDEDPELAALSQFIAAWRETLDVGGDGLTMAKIMAKANELKDQSYANPAFREAVNHVSGMDNERLGKWLRARKGRIVSGYRIESGPIAGGGAARWRLQKI